MTETEESAARKKDEVAARLKARAAGELPQDKVNPAAGSVLAKHTVQPGETLSGIAQAHYGHATREYWMVIYEANQAAIGDNPALIHPGVELVIPTLPPALQGK